MTDWRQFETEAPELAAAVRRCFEAYQHHVLATLRGDGSPRVSGTEVQFRDGDLVMGSMPRALKALDLRRDPRAALHAHPGEMTEGDVKVSGRAVEVLDDEELRAYGVEIQHEPGTFHMFRWEPHEVTRTSVVEDRLLIRTWRPGAGITDFYRS
ncbi:Pyridoxamine 5'-phosphate oxidase [Actinopolyspora xinjiangensis]|uniref:Pyridoxamine 5'-phosphate oxidase n=1 Tax=Actinopolyspora xinjiangensis TaxID=405564 RepID=A0A1H0VTT4_9ACTN|nr:pyridoxamine 5'-phosphate oxidase family protein [Actinopolyspora xinjiangensis]SDP81585.1 Pyridoxamine 5'-phosphate oxidase [Actinopolyspora xinjiangensis]